MTPDRLQARIRAQIELTTPDLEAHLLATEYVSLATRARERLEQCVALVRLGNEQAALQAAETEPPLLDLCAWLNFAELDRWQRLCRERSLPLAPNLDDDAIATVEQLYGKPMDESHPLYRDYRQAMRERDDSRALNVLRLICRLNPTDANAQNELERLRNKFARHTLSEIVRELSANQIERVDVLVSEVERLGATALAGHPDWEQALNRRQEWLKQVAQQRLEREIEKADQSYAARDAKSCANDVAAARHLERTAGIRAQGAAAARLAAAESWATLLLAQEQAEFTASSETAALLLELTTLRQALGPKADGAALRRAGIWLERAAAVADRLPVEATEEVRALRTEAHRRVNRRHTLRVVMGLGILGSVLWLSYQALSIIQAKDAAERDYVQAEAALEIADYTKVRELIPKLANTKSENVAALEKRVQAAEAIEQSCLTEGEALAALSPTDITRENHAEIKRRILAHRAALDALPPLARERILAKSGDLATILATTEKIRGGIEPEVESLVRQLEIAAGRSERLTDPAAAERIIQELRRLVTSSTGPDGISADLADRALARVEWVAERLALEQRGQEDRRRLESATDLESYFSALRLIAQANPPSPSSRAATTILQSSGLLAQLPRPLLAPRVGAMWDSLPEAPPEPILDSGEAAEAAKLLDDQVLKNLRRHIVLEHGSNGRQPIAAVIISGPLNREARKIASGTETLTQGRVLRSSGDFKDESWSLRTFDNGTVNGTELAPALALPEADYLKRLARAVDSTSGRPREPLLQIAERVRRETGSTLLRAYHLQQLLTLAARSPVTSGFAFSPSAQADARELRRLTQNAVGPTDFLFPDRWSAERSNLERFLSTSNTSYLEEARHLQSLLKRVREGGLRLAGRVDAEGKHQLGEEAGVAVFLGIDNAGQLGVLFKGDGNGGLRRLREPMPLTPLLRLGRSPSEAVSALGGTPPGVAQPQTGWDSLLDGTDL